MIKNLFFILLSLAITSCGIGDGGKCELSDVGICVDFLDDLGNAESTAACVTYQTRFDASSKTFDALSGTPCTATNLVGSCTVAAQGTIRYYSTSWDAATGAANCAALGTWTAAR